MTNERKRNGTGRSIERTGNGKFFGGIPSASFSGGWGGIRPLWHNLAPLESSLLFNLSSVVG